jgi:two-component system NtrC family sensor kinase
VCLSFIGFLTFVYYRNISGLRKDLIIVEHFDDLLNDILELRRYEKNFIYNGDMESLREIQLYLAGVENASSKLADSIKRIIGEKGYEKFRNEIYSYKRILQTSANLSKNGIGKINVNAVREKGKALVDCAKNLIQLNRHRIQEALSNALRIPLAFLGTFFVLVLVLLHLITKSILRPLAMVRRATEQVAKETFEPIVYKTKDKDEVSQLIAAFNKMADEIRSGQEQLLQSRKMASIGTFTSGIAHELNNPLNNIFMTAESMLGECHHLSPGEADEMVQDILNQAERASQVVKNLLEFSRTERPLLTDLNVKDVIEGTIRLVKNQIMVTGIQLDVQIADPLPTIRGRRQDLQQALLNILLNSVQAMPKGGTISIRANPVPDGMVKIDLADTGAGIKPSDLEHIFEPFYTTKPVGEGTGLGLSLTYGIVRTHGGYIEVKSEMGKGTVFSIHIPAANGKEEAAIEDA